MSDRCERVELTNMCMVTNAAGQVLVQERVDPGWPGVTFPGGHVDPGESFAASVAREVLEETGIVIGRPTLAGIKQFPEDDGSRYIILLYKAEAVGGELHSSSEGSVYWAPIEDLMEGGRLRDRLAHTFEMTLDLYASGEYHEIFCHEEEELWWMELL